MSALKDFRILELAESPAGEYCGKLLSDFGAELIKVEKPGSGSPTRRMGPFSASVAAPESSGLFAYLNTNKASVALDVESEEGRAKLQRLLAKIDVVIDDHPSGWLKSVGLDPATIEAQHPALVLCSITPFGQDPPEDRRYGEDLNVYHMSGWGYHTPGGGDWNLPPLKAPGRVMPSYEAAFDAALCIAAALYEREESGQGRFIDIDRQATLTSRSDYVLSQFLTGDMDVTLERTAFDLNGPAGILPCKDGHVYVWFSTSDHWIALRATLGEPEWARDLTDRWLELDCTPERVALIRRHVAAWLQTRGKREAAEEAQKSGLTIVPVFLVSELEASPQLQFRRFFTSVEHPALGRAVYPTVPYQMSATPAKIETPAPLLGQHTREKLAGLAGESGGGSRG